MRLPTSTAAGVLGGLMGGLADWSAQSLAHAIRERGVRVVAWDFDQTLLGVHSGGLTFDRPADLANKMSAGAVALVRALEAAGVANAVVTYADDLLGEAHRGNSRVFAGSRLVRAVLDASPLRGVVFDPMVCHHPKYLLATDKAPRELCAGKKYHLKKVEEAHEASPAQILLIDDASENCAQALADGYRVIQVTGDRGFHLDGIEIL